MFPLPPAQFILSFFQGSRWGWLVGAVEGVEEGKLTFSFVVGVLRVGGG